MFLYYVYGQLSALKNLLLLLLLKLTKTIGVLNCLRYEYPEEILLPLYGERMVIQILSVRWGCSISNVFNVTNDVH